MDNRKQITLLVENGTQKKTYNVMEYKNNLLNILTHGLLVFQTHISVKELLA